jgi:hypothetical protein
VSSVEKSDYELAVKLNTSEREGINKQNELKLICVFFLKTHLSLNLNGRWVKIRVFVPVKPFQPSLMFVSLARSLP